MESLPAGADIIWDVALESDDVAVPLDQLVALVEQLGRVPAHDLFDKMVARLLHGRHKVCEVSCVCVCVCVCNWTYIFEYSY